MPMDPHHYPPAWKPFSHWVRHVRAHNRCECTGQCGLHQPNPRTRRCTERQHAPARYARGHVVLTTAHLCQCNPICMNPDHVIAACQRCHLRIDRQLHARHARATRARAQTKNPPEHNTSTPARDGHLHPRREPRRRF